MNKYQKRTIFWTIRTHKMDLKTLFGQIGKFGIIGIFGSIFNYSIFFILFTIFDVNYLVAGVFGFLLPVPFIFVANRNWTFRSDVSYKRGLSVYILTNIVALAAHSTTQFFAHELLGIAKEYSQLFGIFASATVNFIFAKFIVFREGNIR